MPQHIALLVERANGKLITAMTIGHTIEFDASKMPSIVLCTLKNGSGEFDTEYDTGKYAEKYSFL